MIYIKNKTDNKEEIITVPYVIGDIFVGKIFSCDKLIVESKWKVE